MTRRYIDFAPAKKGGASPKGAVSGARRTVSTGTVRSNATRPMAAYVGTLQADGARLGSGRSSVTRTGATRVGVSRTNGVQAYASQTSGTRAYASRAGVSGAGVSRAGVSSVGASRTGVLSVGASRTGVARARVSRTATAKPTVKMPSNAVVRERRVAGTAMAGRRNTRNTIGSGAVGVKAGGEGMALGKSRVKLGEIEDLNQKFVTKDVPKRPLGSDVGTNKMATGLASSGVISSGAAEAKAKKVGGRFRRKKTNEKKVGKRVAAKNGLKEDFAVPNSPFINQDKVVKRPLSKNSKNVYQKSPAVSAVEKQEGVVRIVKQPKKESHVGMVVAVILTIILGAVAGTVAFLLLPK